MNNRNTIPMDWTRDKMSLLLRKLQSGLLDREEAKDLKPLVEEELRNAEKVGFSAYVDQLKVLIGLLNLYIEGKIDLYSSIVKDIKFANLD